MTEQIHDIAIYGEGGGGCFRAGTLIQLDGGKTIAIEQLKVGDKVLSFNENGTLVEGVVTKVHYHEDPQPLLRVKYWRGELSGITPNHWVLNQYGNFAEMGRLTYEDALVDGMGHLRPIIGATHLPKEPVWNLTVEPCHTFIADGVRVHNGGHREYYPVISGEGGGGKGGGHTATEDPDSVQSRAIVSLLDLIGEGQIGGLVNGGQSIFFNDTPLQNPDGSYNFHGTNSDGTFNSSGITWAFRTGHQLQTPISGFSDIETPFNCNVQVKQSVPYAFAVSNPEADSVRCIVTLPALSSTDNSSGDIHGATVQYKFQLSVNGGPFNDVAASTALGAAGWLESQGNDWIVHAAGGSAINSATVAITGTDAGNIVYQTQYLDTNGVWQNYGPQNTLHSTWRTVNIRDVGGHGDSASNDSDVSSNSGNAGDSGDGESNLNAVFYGEKDGSYQDDIMVRRQNMAAVPGSTYRNGQLSVLSFESAGTPQIPAASLALRIHVLAISGPVKLVVSSPISAFPAATCTIVAKSRSKYQRQHLIRIPPHSGAVLRMVRLTPDSTSSLLSNDTYLDSYDEIVSVKLSYPNSALAAIRIDSAQFNSIPTRSYDVWGLIVRVPSNYNPVTRVYSGIWDGTFKMAVTSNPAWVLYDLLLHPRYGLGQFIDSSQVDASALYAIGRYCDEMVPDGFGGTEPRFTINTAIQTQADAYKVIGDICSVFRGMAYWNGGQVGFTQDRPSDIAMIFGQANVIDGVFTYTGTSRKDRHSVVNVTWNDPNDNYRQKIEYVEDPELINRYGVRRLDTVAFGCTSRGQAHRVGKWILYTEKYESDVVTFKVGIDSAMVLPGDVVMIHDEMRAGKRMHGRLAACTTTGATLDAPVVINGPATIALRLPDGTFTERSINESGTVQSVSWDAPLPAAPVANAIWLIHEPDLAPMQARIVSVSQDNAFPDQFTIVAVENNPDKYALIEQDISMSVHPTSILSPNFVSGIQDFKVTESTYLASQGTLGYKLHLSWFSQSANFSVKYRRVSPSISNWTTVSVSDAPSCDIEGLIKGKYELQVVAINPIGVSSAPFTFSYQLVGKQTPPTDVAVLSAEKRPNDILLSWSTIGDFDLAGYEVREGSSWDSARVIVTNYQGNSITDHRSEAGAYQYMVRAINLEGFYSAKVTSAICNVITPAPVDGFVSVQSGSDISMQWRPSNDVDNVFYEIREGSSWALSQLVARVSATSYKTPAGGITSNRIFWIVAVNAPGIYGDTPEFTETAIAQPANLNTINTNDQQANSFPGVKLFTHISTYNGQPALQMNPGALYGEYLFDNPLPKVMTAQNSLYAALASVQNDTLTWAQSNFTWNDVAANRPWQKDGMFASVSARYQLSMMSGLQTGELDGWRFNNSLKSVGGLSPTTQTGTASYDVGRYGNGIKVTDTLRLAYTSSIPATFSKLLWLRETAVYDSIIWRATGPAGIGLTLTYSTSAGAFMLTDSNGKTIKVPYAFSAGDYLAVGISQDATARALMVQKMGDPTTLAYASAALAPLGQFSGWQLF